MLGREAKIGYKNSFCDLQISEMSREHVPFRTPIKRMQTKISWRCLLDISVDSQEHSCQRWNYREIVWDRSSEVEFLQSAVVGFAPSPTGWF